MRLRGLLGITVSLILAACTHSPPPPPPLTLDPQADAKLREMSAFLAGKSAFSFQVYSVSETVRPNGQKVEFARNSAVTVRRPDRLNVQMTGDQENMRFAYDGTHMTIHNAGQKVYGQIPLPPSLDAALEKLAKEHGLVIPLADLVESDPYKALSPLIRSSEYLGTGVVFDTRCHHLAFRQDAVDWQIWVEEGPNPLPRKVVITYKQTPAQLQYSAYLSNWNMAPALGESTFRFTPAPDDRQIDALVPATRPAAR